MASGVRIDKWLWCVRLYKTRTAATKACDAGEVYLLSGPAASRLSSDVSSDASSDVSDEGDPTKPARRVAEGDVITVKRKTATTRIVVRQLREKRVSAALAAEAYDDISPEPTADELEERALRRALKTAPPGRDRGTGRPTKRDRRRLDQLRGRDE